MCTGRILEKGIGMIGDSEFEGIREKYVGAGSLERGREGAGGRSVRPAALGVPRARAGGASRAPRRRGHAARRSSVLSPYSSSASSTVP